MIIAIIILSFFLIYMIGFCILWFSNQINQKYANDLEKNSAYECGFLPFYFKRIEIEIHFYIIALLFLIFDLEISIMLPFIIIFNKLNYFTFIVLCTFGFFFFLSFFYEMYEGGLDLF